MIKATIIKDSIANGVRITTFELDYPRFIHSELMTHRVFSRNAASSRAIPTKVMNDNINANPAMPIQWGMNNAGMQSHALANEDTETRAIAYWQHGKDEALFVSSRLADLGLHKQIVNRVTEPYQVMKTIVTSTEWSNWYELRAHPDAQPEIHQLASLMYLAHAESVPEELTPGEWHVPYVHTERLEGKLTYSVDDTLLTIEDARIISASCCAQVSYRKNDDSLAKAKIIYEKLIHSKPQHASPIEHQATPMRWPQEHLTSDVWELGSTHMDRLGRYWSNNFRGWVQYRALI